MLEHLRAHLKDKKVVICGIGNSLRSDDAIGSLLARRLQGKVPHTVIDAGVSPENYLEKIIKYAPGTLLMIDAVDFGAKPGQMQLLEGEDLKTSNLFFTHNASLSMAINYLKSNITVDIIVLIIQPKSIRLGEGLSPELDAALNELENFFYGGKKEKG